MATGAKMIGRYHATETVGRGGFGTVYRASDPEHGREVAIKVLSGALGETERRRFDRERQTMGRLGGHANIVAVHDSGYTEDGEAYLVMELATGGSLQSRLETDRTVPWPEAVTIMASIADAVEVAHRNGVLHRDIKPDNILIDAYGTPKLSDFGIAAVASNATATTSTTATLAHAAPEVLEGHPSTESVDVYAVGSTLHTLISGSPPFVRPGDQVVATLVSRIATEPPPDLRPFGVPDSVAAVIERSMAKPPEHRQATAAGLAAELRAAATAPATPAGSTVAAPVLASAPTIPSATPRSAPPLAQPEQAPAPAAPSRTGLLLAVIGVLVVGVIALALALLLSGNSDGESDVTTDSTSASTTTVDVAEPTTTDPPTTEQVTTTAALVVQDLTAQAFATASSSAEGTNDGCGNPTDYQPANVLDDNTQTAWRTAGDGSGESVELSFNREHAITSVGLLPGYDKRDLCTRELRYTENRRITAVRWTIGSEAFTQSFVPSDSEVQTLTLPEPVTADRIVVEILSTTEHGGRDFTAISSIQIFGE